MAKTDSTRVLWKVQYRKARNKPWITRRGSFETRETARRMAAFMRNWNDQVQKDGTEWYVPGYGFGNTRVTRFVRGEKK